MILNHYRTKETAGSLMMQANDFYIGVSYGLYMCVTFPPLQSHEVDSLFLRGKNSDKIDAVINIAIYTYLRIDSQKAMDLINHALMSSLAETKPKRFNLFHCQPSNAKTLIDQKIFLEKCIKADHDEIQARLNFDRSYPMYAPRI